MTRCITSQIELSFDQTLKGLMDCHTGCSLQSVLRSILDDLGNIRLAFSYSLRNVILRGWIRDGVAYADTETIKEETIICSPVKSCRVASGPFSRNTT